AVGFGQTLGNLAVTSSGSFLESAGIKALSAPLKWANGGTFNGSVTTTGVVTVNADTDANATGTFTMAGGVAVNTNSNALSITTDKLTLTATSTLNSATATTTLQASDNETIGLGTGAGQIKLTNTILGNITSGALVIGGATTGT